MCDIIFPSADLIKTGLGYYINFKQFPLAF